MSNAALKRFCTPSSSAEARYASESTHSPLFRQINQGEAKGAKRPGGYEGSQSFCGAKLRVPGTGRYSLDSLEAGPG